MTWLVMTIRAKGRRLCQHTTTHQDTIPGLATLRGTCAAAAASVAPATHSTPIADTANHTTKKRNAGLLYATDTRWLYNSHW